MENQDQFQNNKYRSEFEDNVQKTTATGKLDDL